MATVAAIDDDPRAVALARSTHRLIKALTEAIEGFRFNSGIARIYAFLNELKALPPSGASPALLAARAEARQLRPTATTSQCRPKTFPTSRVAGRGRPRRTATSSSAFLASDARRA